jgi:hypothetical protein
MLNYRNMSKGRWAIRPCAILATLVPIWAVNAGGNHSMSIDKNLAEQMAAARGSERRFPLIVTMERSEDLELVKQHGIQPTLVYESIPAFAAQLTGEQIETLTRLPQVKRIELDQKAWALEPH